MKPRIVLSAVNFVEGGPLSLFGDALAELAKSYGERYTITALVHRKELFDVEGVEYLEFPEVKLSWVGRLRFEYFTCKQLSRELNAHLWLAMHDITPRVEADVRAVYCHNPAPFYKLTMREALVDKTFTMFCVFYKFLYGIGIRKNDWVIVQQEWLRKEFEKRYGVKRVVVAHPSMPPMPVLEKPVEEERRAFFYPALARSFKNVETLLAAAEMLEKGGAAFEVWVTVDGTENVYAARLREKFGALHSVRWLGKIPRAEVTELYARAGCLVFPSRLETWGMPISEWKETGKPMLLADLPYAHETVGTYDKVRFFAATDAQALAAAMKDFLGGGLGATPVVAAPVAQPYAESWKELFELLLH